MIISELAERYFALMHSRNLDGLAGLFEDDAMFVLPDGREVVGLSAIRGMYQHIWSAGAPVPMPGAIVAHGNCAATEIDTMLKDGSRRQTANFFQAGGTGKLSRVSVYQRG